VQSGHDAPGRSLAQVLIARSPNGVLVTDATGRLRAINPIVRHMVPLVPKPVGRTPLEAVPIPELADALRPERHDEVELAVRSGHRDLLVRVVSLDGEGGRLAILQDVTRLKQAERHRIEFVGNVSHELRTPATAIAGYAETLLDDREQLDPIHVDMVEVIQRNAKRLVDLFDDLLQLSRLDAREGKLPLEPTRLSGIVAEAVDKQRAVAEAKGVTFQTFVSERWEIMGNRDALGHIVGNLVSNAVKYSHEHGIVTVRTRMRGDRVALEVIDVGFGIDPAHHDRIFERFYRVDKGRARKAGGTGLGLAIVRRLVEAMGAEIHLRSRPGRGSVFRVLLEPHLVPELTTSASPMDSA